jgi:hypothetical protein
MLNFVIFLLNLVDIILLLSMILEECYDLEIYILVIMVFIFYDGLVSVLVIKQFHIDVYTVQLISIYYLIYLHLKHS